MDLDIKINKICIFHFLDIYLAAPYLPLSIYNILIPIVYAVLVWHVMKEDKNNSQVIDLQMRPPGALAREVIYIIFITVILIPFKYSLLIVI